MYVYNQRGDVPRVSPAGSLGAFCDAEVSTIGNGSQPDTLAL